MDNNGGVAPGRAYDYQRITTEMLKNEVPAPPVPAEAAATPPAWIPGYLKFPNGDVHQMHIRVAPEPRRPANAMAKAPVFTSGPTGSHHAVALQHCRHDTPY